VGKLVDKPQHPYGHPDSLWTNTVYILTLEPR